MVWFFDSLGINYYNKQITMNFSQFCRSNWNFLIIILFLAANTFLLFNMNMQISPLKRHIKSIDSDVSSIDSSMDSVQSDVSSIEFDVSSIESDVSSIESDVTAIQLSMDNVESDISSIQIHNSVR